MAENDDEWRENIRKAENLPTITDLAVHRGRDRVLVETRRVGIMKAIGNLDPDDLQLRSLGVESDGEFRIKSPDEYDGGDVVEVTGFVAVTELPSVLENDDGNNHWL